MCGDVQAHQAAVDIDMRERMLIVLDSVILVRIPSVSSNKASASCGVPWIPSCCLFNPQALVPARPLVTVVLPVAFQRT